MGVNSERHEIELRPKQEIQVDGFAIGRDLADKVHPTVVPYLRHCDELFDSILSPKGPRNNKFPLIGLTPTSRATQ